MHFRLEIDAVPIRVKVADHGPAGFGFSDEVHRLVHLEVVVGGLVRGKRRLDDENVHLAGKGGERFGKAGVGGVNKRRAVAVAEVNGGLYSR